MAQMTVGEIITMALDQAGLDSSYLTKGRRWLNYAVNKLAGENDFKFYNVLAPDVAFIAGQVNYALPADFEKVDTLYFIQNQNGNQVQGNQIFILESYKFDQYSRGLAGQPTMAMISTEAEELIFNNIPNSATQSSYRLRYFRKPENYAVDGSDDNVIPDFPSDHVLVEEIMRLAYENLDDERYQSKKQDALEGQRKLQQNQFTDTDSSTVELTHLNFRQRWRR